VPAAQISLPKWILTAPSRQKTRLILQRPLCRIPASLVARQTPTLRSPFDRRGYGPRYIVFEHRVSKKWYSLVVNVEEDTRPVKSWQTSSRRSIQPLNPKLGLWKKDRRTEAFKDEVLNLSLINPRTGAEGWVELVTCKARSVRT
jgi:hypothetical protein